MTEDTVRTHVVIPKALLAEIDRHVGKRKRSAFLTKAVEEKLEHERQSHALKVSAGVLDRDAYPEWATPEKVSAWVRAQRAGEDEAADDTLDRSLDQ